MSTKSQVETAQLEQEQTPGSKNSWRLGNYVLHSDPMEGISDCVLARVGPKYRCPVFSKVEMSAFSSDSIFFAAEAPRASAARRVACVSHD